MRIRRKSGPTTAPDGLGEITMLRMPTVETQAAIDDAHALLEPLRSIHGRELALMGSLAGASGDEVHALHVEINALRTEWIGLFAKYTDAVANYVASVKLASADYPSNR